MTIRNDATRQRIPVTDARPLRGVVARQGQVLLDTDVNEAERTLIDRVESADAAMLGPSDRLLYPAGTTGFVASGTPANCTIGAGTGYLKGWQLVNPATATLKTQINPWNTTPPGAPAVVVLKALVRHIDPVEDTALADVALGDAQASGRAINDWQAFLFPVPAGTLCATVTGLSQWQTLVAPSSGTLAFQIAAPAASSDPCSLTPAGGHSRFENLLYRIEVHGGTPKVGVGTTDGPRFQMQGLKLKLSRRNASLMARIVKIDGNQITVSPPALDPRAWFSAGAYAEFVGPGDDIDPDAALASERLFKITLATDEVITVSEAVATVAGTKAKVSDTEKWFLRLWDAWPDGKGIAEVPANGGPIDLGDGIAIKLGGGANAMVRRGDYWTAAVRADGTIAWPGITTPNPTAQVPHGPEIRYAPLAIMSTAMGAPYVEDCRIPFATLSDRALLYRGGDGQEAFAPEAAAATPVVLAQKLRVAVMRGETPVPGAVVRWRLPAGAQKSWIDGKDLFGGAVDTATGFDGLAEMPWALDAQHQDVAYAVEAVLLQNGQPSNTPPVRFGAQFATAARTSFKPGDCPTLANSTDVQSALDALCKALAEREPETIRLKQIALLRTDPKGSDKPVELPLIREKLILNALTVDADAFAEGIRFEFDPVKLRFKPEKYDPIAEIALDLPYPTTDADRMYWRDVITHGVPHLVRGAAPAVGRFGFDTIRLDGTIDPVKNANGVARQDAFQWTPTKDAAIFLRTAMNHRFGVFARDVGEWHDVPLEQILCRIRLRSALIFGDSPKTKKRIWLNAEHLGTTDKVTGRELLLEERDPQRAADLDMFIYLRVPEPGIVYYYPKGSTAPNRSNLGAVDDATEAALQHWNAQPSQVLLTGYADEPGTAQVNKQLSTRRAQKVRDLLVSKGVAASAITIDPKGNVGLPYPAEPDAEDTLNRRVEVTFSGNFKP